MKNKGVLRGKESSPVGSQHEGGLAAQQCADLIEFALHLFAIHLVGEFDGTLLQSFDTSQLI